MSIKQAIDLDHERGLFELELRKQCFQKPTPEAYDLAWCMWQSRAALAALRSMPAEPLFLLHTGHIDGDGEQYDWDVEADSGARVDAFCKLHPGQEVKLYATPHTAPVLTEADCRALAEANKYSSGIDFARAVESEVLRRAGGGV